MSDLNDEIRKLGVGIVQMVRENGGTMPLMAACRALGFEPPHRSISVIRLAIERVIADKMLTVTGMNCLVVLDTPPAVFVDSESEVEPKLVPKIKSVPKPKGEEASKAKREKVPKKKRRSAPRETDCEPTVFADVVLEATKYVRNRAPRKTPPSREVLHVVREEVHSLLQKCGGPVRTRALFASVPLGARLGGIHRFRQSLQLLSREGWVVRLAPGWYCHPEHRVEALRQYEAQMASADAVFAKQDEEDLQTRRREYILELLHEAGGEMRLSEIFTSVKAKGFVAVKMTVSNDLRAFVDKRQVVNHRRGWYRLVEESTP